MESSAIAFILAEEAEEAEEELGRICCFSNFSICTLFALFNRSISESTAKRGNPISSTTMTHSSVFCTAGGVDKVVEEGEEEEGYCFMLLMMLLIPTLILLLLLIVVAVVNENSVFFCSCDNSHGSDDDDDDDDVVAIALTRETDIRSEVVFDVCCGTTILLSRFLLLLVSALRSVVNLRLFLSITLVSTRESSGNVDDVDDEGNDGCVCGDSVFFDNLI